MTVVLSYTTGGSKLILGVSAIEETDDLLTLSYESGTEIVSKSRVREVRVALE